MTDVEFLHYFLQFCVLVMLDDLTFSVFRTDRPCSGIWTKASICTRWTAVMSSTRSASVPTDTGCVPPQDRASRSGYHQLSVLNTPFMTGFTHLSWLDCVRLVMLWFIVVFHSCYFIYHNSVSIIYVVCELCHAGRSASLWIFHICIIYGKTQHWKSLQIHFKFKIAKGGIRVQLFVVNQLFLTSDFR